MSGKSSFPFVQVATALLGAALPGAAPVVGALGGLVQQAQKPPEQAPLSGAGTNALEFRLAALEKRVATLEHALQLSLTAHSIQWGVTPAEGD